MLMAYPSIISNAKPYIEEDRASKWAGLGDTVATWIESAADAYAKLRYSPSPAYPGYPSVYVSPGQRSYPGTTDPFYSFYPPANAGQTGATGMLSSGVANYLPILLLGGVLLAFVFVGRKRR